MKTETIQVEKQGVTPYELHLKAKEIAKLFEGYSYHEAIYLQQHLKQEIENKLMVRYEVRKDEHGNFIHVPINQDGGIFFEEKDKTKPETLKDTFKELGRLMGDHINEKGDYKDYIK